MTTTTEARAAARILLDSPNSPAYLALWDDQSLTDADILDADKLAVFSALVSDIWFADMLTEYLWGADRCREFRTDPVKCRDDLVAEIAGDWLAENWGEIDDAISHVRVERYEDARIDRMVAEDEERMLRGVA